LITFNSLVHKNTITFKFTFNITISKFTFCEWIIWEIKAHISSNREKMILRKRFSWRSIDELTWSISFFRRSWFDEIFSSESWKDLSELFFNIMNCSNLSCFNSKFVSWDWTLDYLEMRSSSLCKIELFDDDEEFEIGSRGNWVGI